MTRMPTCNGLANKLRLVRECRAPDGLAGGKLFAGGSRAAECGGGHAGRVTLPAGGDGDGRGRPPYRGGRRGAADGGVPTLPGRREEGGGWRRRIISQGENRGRRRHGSLMRKEGIDKSRNRFTACRGPVSAFVRPLFYRIRRRSRRRPRSSPWRRRSRAP